MSTSSAMQSNWRQYGPVMLTRCPNCPRPEPLKRLVTKTDENGNLGREFVKCLSKPMAGRDGKILKKCTHFEWIDEYVQRIKSEGYIDSSVAATWELNLGGVPQMENWGSSDRGAGRVVPMARIACDAWNSGWNGFWLLLFWPAPWSLRLRSIGPPSIAALLLLGQPNERLVPGEW
ncbi:hypothetical protein D1007_36126 [Hordeum vulgare]|nr:hypothetical protein D1007_36126 [Hordeum vulgare]